MAGIFPFAAVRPPAPLAPRVASPPYDVINTAEATALVADNPFSFLRVGRAEVDLPAAVSSYDDAVYAKARETYLRLKREVPLVADDRPCYYVYSLVMNGHRQTGIVAAPAIDDYDSGIIRKHEKTRQDKEDDRTRHIMTLRAQTGPVFLTYRDSDAIARIVSRTMTETPIFDFLAPDGVQHSGWQVPAADTLALQQAFAQVPQLYIADGHHRAASASRTRNALRESNPRHTGSEEYNHFLAVIFPASHLRILPYNRVVADLNGLSAAEFIATLKTLGTVEKATTAEPRAPGMVGVYLEQTWYTVTFSDAAAVCVTADDLDVSKLQDRLLGPVLGIADPRTSQRIDFVGGIRGPAELERLVNQGNAAVAFAMHPTTVEQLMAISDNHQIMPPKSTWFEPKLRDGLFVHEI